MQFPLTEMNIASTWPTVSISRHFWKDVRAGWTAGTSTAGRTAVTSTCVVFNWDSHPIKTGVRGCRKGQSSMVYMMDVFQNPPRIPDSGDVPNIKLTHTLFDALNQFCIPNNMECKFNLVQMLYQWILYCICKA